MPESVLAVDSGPLGPTDALGEPNLVVEGFLALILRALAKVGIGDDVIEVTPPGVGAAAGAKSTADAVEVDENAAVAGMAASWADEAANENSLVAAADAGDAPKVDPCAAGANTDAMLPVKSGFSNLKPLKENTDAGTGFGSATSAPSGVVVAVEATEEGATAVLPSTGKVGVVEAVVAGDNDVVDAAGAEASVGGEVTVRFSGVFALNKKRGGFVGVDTALVAASKENAVAAEASVDDGIGAWLSIEKTGGDTGAELRGVNDSAAAGSAAAGVDAVEMGLTAVVSISVSLSLTSAALWSETVCGHEVVEALS